MENLKNARKDAGLTQQQAADSLGIERPSYARYETGDRQPDIDMLIMISKLFNVTTDYLLGLTNDPQFEQPATIAARPTAGMPPISDDRLNEIIAQAVKAIRAEAAKQEKSPET